jgi:hypothetical protein
MLDHEESIVGKVHGLAICRYESSGAVYRFSCDECWEVLNDAPFENVEAAMLASSMQFRAEDVEWHSGQEGHHR